MEYFNNDNFYSAHAALEEFDSYPFLQCQTLAATEEARCHDTLTFTDCLPTVNQPGPSSDSCLAATTYESLFPMLDSYSTNSHGSYWSTVSQPTHPDHLGTLNGNAFFLGGPEWDTAVQAATLSSTPTDSWCSQQYGVPTDMPYVNPPDHHRLRRGVSKAGTADRWRFTPYETYHTCPTMHENAEVGPSTQPPPPVPYDTRPTTQPLPPIPYDTRPTTQPTGGLSEATADAEQTKSFTEEDGTPGPRSQLPRGEGVVRPHRERNREDILTLRTWAKALRGSRVLPSHQDAVAAATEIISVFRPPVYDEDKLSREHGRRTGAGSREADEERERRSGTRQVYKRLSRCYHLEGGRSTWTMTQLLSRVLEDLDIIDNTLRNVSVPA